MKKLVLAFLAVLFFQDPAFGAIKVGISDDKFTINDKETLLLGVSYFDAFNWHVSDLDQLSVRGYNLIRIWLDWRDQGFFDSDGNLIWAEPLVDLVEASDARGLVVDVTILDGELTFDPSHRKKVVRQAVSALKGKHNVIFDIMNAHDYGQDALSHTKVKTLIEAAIEENPNAIITVSSGPGHIIKGETLRGIHVDEELNAGAMILAPHLPRTNDWYSRTDERVTLIKNYLNDQNQTIPLYLQEEARRGYNGMYPTQDQFLQAVKAAFSAGAAAWILHTAAGFDLTGGSFFSQLDAVEKSTIDALPKKIFGPSASSNTTASTVNDATLATNTTSGSVFSLAPIQQSDAAVSTNTFSQNPGPSSTSLAASSGPEDYVPQVAGVVNVKSFGAKGDGVTDDTAAIQQAITQTLGTHSGSNNIIYFPNGTYLVSNRLEPKGTDGKWDCAFTVQGESRDGAVIRLKNNAPGYGSPSSPKAVLYSTSCSFVTGGGADYIGLGEGNQAFQNDVINLTVNTGTGNPGAIGIDYLSNNQGSVENVRIVSGDGNGVAGLSMIRKWPGPSLISKVTIEGFNYGIQMGQAEYHVTFEHIILKNQKIAGLYNNNNAASIRDLVSTNTVPAVRNSGSVAHLVILDSTLSGGSSGVSAIENNSGAQLFARNTVTSGYKSALTHLGAVLPGSTITEFVSGAKTSLFPSPAQSMNLPIQETPEYSSNNPADWVSVTAYGAAPGGGDDTAGIQAAIDSGKPVVYLPNGNYQVSAPVIIRGNVRKIIGFGDPTLSPVSGFAGPFFRTGTINNTFVVVENVDKFYDVPIFPVYEHAGSKTLVLKRMRNVTARTVAGAGPLFLQDFGGIHFGGGHLEVNGTQVWGRQFNPEGQSPHILNNGGQVWMLGFKTEGASTIVDTRNGGKTEILGGYDFPGTSLISAPAFVNTDSHHSIIFATPAWTPGYATYFQETRSGVTKTLPASSLPGRGTGRFVPLHLGYTSGGTGGDTTPPTVSLTAPANGATVSGSSVSVTANASDNVGVASVDFKVDGVILFTDTASPYTMTWNTTSATSSAHTLTATAKDAAGNQTTSSAVTVTVNNTTTDTTPPTVPTGLVASAVSSSQVNL
ncbi:MAG: Ig-like domain-containing protein, partial [Gammaproteobacteria bacterium]|nr:Ig-like domain-containing protein [Gammaproteobacteria bacterium]